MYVLRALTKRILARMTQVCRYALENCPDDLEFLEGFEEKDKREKKLPPVQTKLRQRLLDVVEKDFAVITYTDMVALLQDHMKAKKVKFEKNVTWGDDLGTEHERYVCEKVYGRPTIVKDYPKVCRSALFYNE